MNEYVTTTTASHRPRRAVPRLFVFSFLYLFFATIGSFFFFFIDSCLPLELGRPNVDIGDIKLQRINREGKKK